jgi:deoxyribodipyrimidine photo-lyase
LFPLAYNDILDRVAAINPWQYSKTRNHTNGAVTYLSPYISRGVISTRLVYEHLKSKGYAWYQIEKLVQELAWRDYFQQVWMALGPAIFNDIKQPQPRCLHRQLPAALLAATTGIEAIDSAIKQLEHTGYMHNHVRMYTASIACNIAGAHWSVPASWMYYHLLDGDIASNTCSWQWVAGAFSSKKYYANQENINRYTGSLQTNTFLSQPYEALVDCDVPETLQDAVPLHLSTPLPATLLPEIDTAKPILLYHPYHLDATWRQHEAANRILVLEPSHYRRFPVSEQVIHFIIQLSKNIEGCQVFTGEVAQLEAYVGALTGNNAVPSFITREHPAFGHFPGQKDNREWLSPAVNGYFPSFFSYWKKLEKHL